MREMYKERNILYLQCVLPTSNKHKCPLTAPKLPDLCAGEESLPVSFVKICYHFLFWSVFAIKK